MERNEQRALLEALIFVSEEPLSAKRLGDALKIGKQELQELVQELQQSYGDHHGLTLIEVAGGYRITCRPEFGERIRKFLGRQRHFRLTGPSLETLAIVAYKQPLTRAEIDEIRGVATEGVVRTLLERKFIKIVGRKDEIGRPFMFGTTKLFLEHFGLKSLQDLPDVSQLEEMVGTIEEKEEERLVEADPNADLPSLDIAEEELTGTWAVESAVVVDQAESGPVVPPVPDLETALAGSFDDGEPVEAEFLPDEEPGTTGAPAEPAADDAGHVAESAPAESAPAAAVT